MSSSPLLIFIHVPKTAGTTLHETLGRLYGPERLFYVADSYQPRLAAARYHRLPEAVRGKIQVFAGHCYADVRDFLPRPSRMLTMLRDPVRREISTFHQVRRTQDSTSCASGQTKTEPLTMQAYFTSEAYAGQDNQQTRLLAGLHEEDAALSGACDEETFLRAMHNLDTQFESVGLTEQYDQSVMLMRHRFGWKLPFYVRRNVTASHVREHMTADILEALRRSTRFDQKLYQYAAQKFQQEVATQGGAFARDVRLFQIANRLWTAKYHLWYARRQAAERTRTALPSFPRRLL